MSRVRSTALTAALAVFVAIAIHVDYHLGRSPSDNYSPSLGLGYHWVLGFVTLAVVGWTAVRLWPAAAIARIGLVVGIGIFLGQIVEPLVETWMVPDGMGGGHDAERWRLFAEFLGAGVVGLVGGYVLGLRRGLHPGRA